ncbi:hypothetical protein VTN77DRAFT_9650 [Rasamsonia byssochlamydoides]|uniref:uncharacterized protein n=1 Tax=Rasamsonia byssochlamydoides TaxID=89139 RepID=UPI003743DA5B
MGVFRQQPEEEKGLKLPTFDSLYQWSIARRAGFRHLAWRHFNIIHEGIINPRRLTKSGKEDDKIAVTEVREGVAEGTKDITWRELRQRTGKLAQVMKEAGVGKGDRVTVVVSNSANTLLVFLALTSLGGLFSSSSTDISAKGILDQLTRIKPQLVFMDDFAIYNGKRLKDD